MGERGGPVPEREGTLVIRLSGYQVIKLSGCQVVSFARVPESYCVPMFESPKCLATQLDNLIT